MRHSNFLLLRLSHLKQYILEADTSARGNRPTIMVTWIAGTSNLEASQGNRLVWAVFRLDVLCQITLVSVLVATH